MPAQVLILTPDLSTIGGVETYYNALELPKRDNRLEYFFVNSGQKESPLQLAWRMLKNYWLFWNKLADNQYHTVLINPSLNPNSFYRDAIFCWIALQKRKNVGVFFRGWSEELEEEIKVRTIPKLFFRFSFQRINKFIVLSSLFKKKLLEMGCDLNSRFWIESTVADDSYLPDFSIADRVAAKDAIHVLFMARIVASKGAQLALEAFHLAKQRVDSPRLVLIVAGDGPDLPQLKAWAAARQVPDVEFLGYVRGEQKKQAILRSDIMLFPTSHGEGLPNAVLEAMLYGMPILSRINAGIPDVVTHGENGFLTESTDPQLFADWLVRLATDQQLRAQISQANHQKAIERFTSTKVRHRLVRIIEEISGE